MYQSQSTFVIKLGSDEISSDRRGSTKVEGCKAKTSRNIFVYQKQWVPTDVKSLQLGIFWKNALFRVSQTRNHCKHAWGTFWIVWQLFGQKLTLFLHISQLVLNHTACAVHENKQATLYGYSETHA